MTRKHNYDKESKTQPTKQGGKKVWADIFVGDETKRREKRRKRIAAMKAKKTKTSQQKMIDKKDLGWKAVKEQQKKKKMLKDAGK